MQCLRDVEENCARLKPLSRVAVHALTWPPPKGRQFFCDTMDSVAHAHCPATLECDLEVEWVLVSFDGPPMRVLHRLIFALRLELVRRYIGD